MEIFVKGSLGKGYLDLYDQFTNTYFEIKSYYEARKYKTIVQMSKYDSSIVVKNDSNRNKGVVFFHKSKVKKRFHAFKR